VTKVTAGNMSNCRFGRIVTMTLVQTAWWGWCLAMVSGPEGVVAQLGGPAVMIRGGSRRVWCHIVRRRLGWVQMRCRECAAEVAVTAGVCSGCGAPIVGQPPVVADTVVADTVVAAISDAAGKAVPAGVAEQALPKPYVPGAGDKRHRGRSTASGQRSNGSR
jgi:hypothetical protein